MEEYMYQETRFRMLKQSDPERAEWLLKMAEKDAVARWNQYKQMAAMDYSYAAE